VEKYNELTIFLGEQLSPQFNQDILEGLADLNIWQVPSFRRVGVGFSQYPDQVSTFNA
jgi:hypothetical protein